MYYKRSSRLLSLIMLLLSTLTVFTGCTVGSGRAPGSSGTVVGTSTSSSARCAPATPAVSLSPGWAWSANCTYGFQVPVPPGWHIGAYAHTSDVDGSSQDIIDMLPSENGNVVTFDSAIRASELLRVAVVLQPPDFDTQEAADPNLTAEPGTVVVGGQRAVVYDFAVPPTAGAPAVQREVVVRFGGHPYLFLFRAPAATAQRDASLFLTLLANFTYGGTSR